VVSDGAGGSINGCGESTGSSSSYGEEVASQLWDMEDIMEGGKAELFVDVELHMDCARANGLYTAPVSSADVDACDAVVGGEDVARISHVSSGPRVHTPG
jgi:hypothetical protein